MASSPNSSSTVTTAAFQIPSLLSTCVDACQRGCIEIRKVQAAREEGNGDALKVTLKEAADPRSALTEADKAAHEAIVGALRQEWGNDLVIIGEEDEEEDSDDAAVDRTKDKSSSFQKKIFEPLKRDMFDDDIGNETPNVDPSRIRVFVDALDGTREFVEGRLSNCQVLIGISVNGQAVAGAVGIPFPDGDLSSEPTVVYGMVDVGTGVIGTPLRRGPYPLEHHIDGLKYPRPHHATGDSSAQVLEACRKGVVKRFGGSIVFYGGAGNKILAAALGEVACCIQHRIGGPWDLCAPEAILKAMGGKMTDLFGRDIQIYRDDAPTRCNEWGYLATAPGSSMKHDDLFHEALVASLLALPQVQEYKQAVVVQQDESMEVMGEK
jgi:3'-phosphoadenosine 5'-phosphosulfate (PAPS) 3'-phosphatase